MNLLSIDFATIWGNIIDLLNFDPKQPLMFSSGLFWVLFLVFLPIFALLRRNKTQMTIFVIAFSLYFFFKSSGWFFLLLVFTAVLDWIIARRIAQSQSKSTRKALLWLSIVCSLGILAYFKYANFFMVNLTALVGGNFQPLDILLPVGISFYTFRTISYVVDVYKGKMQPVESFTDYLFFLSFFPCLVAGPIVRARDFMPQLQELKPATAKMIYGGLWLVMLGIIKKAVVADYIGLYNNIVFDNPGGYSGVELLMAILGYTMQIYCDFSGYSDMAIGLGAIMGFDLGINFDFPYRSLNVTEFWRRWHISLSFWLRDYLYIPLGGNRKGKSPPVFQPHDYHAARRLVARRCLDLRHLGIRPWLGLVHPQIGDEPAQAARQQSARQLWCMAHNFHLCSHTVGFLPCRQLRHCLQYDWRGVQQIRPGLFPGIL